MPIAVASQSGQAPSPRSRFLKDAEFKKAVVNDVFPVAHVIAMDGVCPVVHPSNPVNELTTAQVRAIYKGEIKNWKELGGVDMPIVVISRDTSSGTYESFNELVMHKEKMAPNVEYVNSNPQAHARGRLERALQRRQGGAAGLLDGGGSLAVHS